MNPSIHLLFGISVKSVGEFMQPWSPVNNPKSYLLHTAVSPSFNAVTFPLSTSSEANSGSFPIPS